MPVVVHLRAVDVATDAPGEGVAFPLGDPGPQRGVALEHVIQGEHLERHVAELGVGRAVGLEGPGSISGRMSMLWWSVYSADSIGGRNTGLLDGA